MDSHPDLKLIMAPTTVGIAAAAKAMQDEGLCDKIKVSGLGLPAEMAAYVPDCSPKFALWSFDDLGYVTNYATYLLATGALQGVEGETFEAGRMGDLHHREGPDPRQRAPDRDGSVHGLRRDQRRRLTAASHSTHGRHAPEGVAPVLFLRQWQRPTAGLQG